MPKVSICIPAYQQADYLKKTLESVFMQTYTDYEVIVTDDSRDDAVKNMVLLYEPNTKLRYFKNPERLGAPANWNNAIELSTGEYIKIMHHDDFFTEKDSLAKFVGLLDNNPDTDFAFSAAVAVNVVAKTNRPHLQKPQQLAALKKSPFVLFYGNFIGPPSSIIFRRRKEYLFDVNLKWAVDICFYIECLTHNSKFAFSADQLITSVIDTHNVTNECVDNKEIEVFEYVYMYEKTTRNKLLTKIKLMRFFRTLFTKYTIVNVDELLSIMKGRKVPVFLKIALYLK